MDYANCLEPLNTRVRRELRLLGYPHRPWVEPKDDCYNVLVIGGGQAGLATAFGLLKERVDRVLVVDRNPRGFEGPWETFARMETLRTPKHLTGPDLGVPSLTFQSWYEAQHGRGAWDTLDKIPKGVWMRYLRWYRGVLGLPVANEVEVEAVIPEAEGRFRVETRWQEQPRTLYTRRVVWATGMDGDGVWWTPALIREALPPERYAHTSRPIDFAALRDKRVGVLGAGASAFDNAATALEQGAKEVHLFFRRPQLPRINPYRWMEFSGFLQHHADLDDGDKWRFAKLILDLNQPPPQDTFTRASRHPNFYLHPASSWERVSDLGDEVAVETYQAVFRFDFLIIGTGMTVDLRARRELAAFAGEIALWRDRYAPLPGDEDARLSDFPYLGANFELSEKTPGTAPYLKHLYDFTFGATPSMGLSGASISGMKYGVQRLVRGITASFYREDVESYYASLANYDEAELTADVAPVLYQQRMLVEG